MVWAEEVQTLRVWMNWMLEEMPGKMAAIAKFEEENPGVKIRHSRIPGEAHYNPQDQKLMCSMCLPWRPVYGKVPAKGISSKYNSVRAVGRLENTVKASMTRPSLSLYHQE